MFGAIIILNNFLLLKPLITLLLVFVAFTCGPLFDRRRGLCHLQVNRWWMIDAPSHWIISLSIVLLVLGDGFAPVVDVDVEALLNHLSVLQVDQVGVGLRRDRQLVLIDLIVQLRQLV